MFHQMLHFLNLKDDVTNDAFAHFSNTSFNKNYPCAIDEEKI